MRVRVLDLATGHQATDFDQFVDHSFVRVAFAAFAVEDVFATKERQIRAETTVVHHVIGDDLLKHSQIAIQFEFFHTVAWRTVHEARAFFVSDKVSGAEIADVIPFAVGTLGPASGCFRDKPDSSSAETERTRFHIPSSSRALVMTEEASLSAKMNRSPLATSFLRVCLSLRKGHSHSQRHRPPPCWTGSSTGSLSRSRHGRRQDR